MSIHQETPRRRACTSRSEPHRLPADMAHTIMENIPFLPKLPNEVWTKIFAYLVSPRWEANDDLANIRLTCSLFHELGSIHMFRQVTLFKDIARLRRAVDFLCRNDLAKHIRQLRLRTPSWSDFGIGNDSASLNIDLDGNFHVDGQRIFNWVPTVTSHLSRLFQGCASTLRSLEIEGIIASGDLFSGYSEQLEKDICDCVGDVLNSVYLPSLRALRMELQDFGSASNIAELYQAIPLGSDGSTGVTLRRTFNQLKHFELVNDFITQDHNQESAQELINMASKIELKSLQIVSSRGRQTITPLFEATFSQLTSNQSLFSLELEDFQTTDKISDMLKSMPQLQKVKLYRFMIYKDMDRWEYIFHACLLMENLKFLNLSRINYVEHLDRFADCSGFLFCTPFEDDKAAYLQLFVLISVMKAKGKPGHFELFGLCNDCFHTQT